jgi:hypothetical protein
MNSVALISRYSSGCAQWRDRLARWWPGAICVGLIVAIGVVLGTELHRMAAIRRSLAGVCEAGGLYALDGEAHGRPVVSINLDSYLIDDAGQVHRRGRATDPLLALLPPFDRLRELSLIGADVTDAGLTYLTELKALRRLSLRGTHVTDAGVSRLARCSNLRWIDLRETRVTPAGVGLLQVALTKAEILVDTD